jgi:iron complex transport system permease protein
MSQILSLTIRAKKRKIAVASMLFLLFLFIVINLITGANGIHISDLFKAFSAQNNYDMILMQIRLPRVLAAILAGALLGLSGAIMQGSLKNPLASPFTLGISQAAAFGASFAIIILQAYSNEMSFSSHISVGACAFGASILCMGIILSLGKFSSLSPSSMILAGVGLGSLFHALTMFLQYFADDVAVAATLFWTFGELGKASWDAIAIMAIVFTPIYLYFLSTHWKMDALSFGDDSAKSRGVEVDRFRLITLLLSSLLSAIAVSFLGIIGFIGLVAPHIVRMILGHSHYSILSLSALVGAILLLAADFVSKIILMPIILPIGILTSFMGVPIFLYLLLKRGS